ncbi:MAG: hypothetical protein LBK94_01910 [Prevotellaceae bacterium]|jgi:hypothetical protein|nr:hypothetical protein [Prevotellaceae bacterium]
MKKTINTLKFSAILLLLAGSFFSCGKEEKGQKPEIYENHEISACNVDDTLVNIDWLKQFCEEHNKSKFTIEIYLYNDINNINTVLTVTKPFMYRSQEAQRVSAYPYNQFVLKDCSGNVIMQGEIFVDDENISPDTPDWAQFFEINENIGLIWAINKE